LDYTMPGVPLHGSYSIKKMKEKDMPPVLIEPEWEGGFDAVIGNPPYIFTREQIAEVERKYFSDHYKLSWEKHNTFMLFMEALLHLLKESGSGGFIVPNSWLTIESGQFLREKYVRRLEILADLNYAVFNKVSMEPCIFIARGQETKSDVKVVRAATKEEFLSAKPFPLKRSAWSGSGFRMVLAASGGLLEILDKIRKNSCAVESKFQVRTGLQAYEKGKGDPAQTEKDVREHIFDRAKREDESSVRYLEGRDVGRYKLSWSKMWMQYGPWLSQPREIGMFTRPRVLLREITAPPPYCLYTTFSSEAFLNNKSILNVLHPSDREDELKALACILNSRLLSVFYKNQAVKGARTIFPKVVIKNLREFPYPQTLDDKLTSKLAAYTDIMLVLHSKFAAARTPQEKTALERQIAATDSQIDTLVYELYGLTAEEIAIVEGDPAKTS
jgi:TaqI-like C-terminal specificity domain/Eco57I restriction-modification methylase